MFHRDLKPKNILANSDCKLKVCDFGLARPSFNDMPTTIFWTDYVATRWYRAPELCGSFFAKYSPAIDIWSIGCIFAEILQGKPLFPGRNVVHQLELITDLLGTPASEVIDKVRRCTCAFNACHMPCYSALACQDADAMYVCLAWAGLLVFAISKVAPAYASSKSRHSGGSQNGRWRTSCHQACAPDYRRQVAASPAACSITGQAVIMVRCRCRCAMRRHDAS